MLQIMLFYLKIFTFFIVLFNLTWANNTSFLILNGNKRQSIKVNILLLLPLNDTYKFSVSKVLPALNLAVDEIKKTDYGSSFDLNIIPDVCDCTGITAPVNAMENIYGKRNHSLLFQAVFGPMCD